MNYHFYKYQGAGNDFILIDNRDNKVTPENFPCEIIEKMCDRRFGIGADGMMLLQKHDKYDFEMAYYNSDGRIGSMCGNGGRCITSFAHLLGIAKHQTSFLAVDGLHEALIFEEGHRVKLKMMDVSEIENAENFYYMNTGSPHYVEFVGGLDDLNVFARGREIRNNDRFRKVGTNVNFVEYNDLATNQIRLRTYERGVEDETLACGTGTVAAAISSAICSEYRFTQFDAKVQGGNLKVYFDISPEKTFSNIWLEGPALLVFEGIISL